MEESARRELAGLQSIDLDPPVSATFTQASLI